MSMRKINWEELANSPDAALLGGKKTALTIGVFDGVHRGHQSLIARVSGKAPEMVPTVLTFGKNPKTGHTNDIISFDEKTALFEALGVELCVIIDFTRNFSIMGGRAFFEELCRLLNPGYAAIGRNFHCGYRRDTGADAFKALADARPSSFEVEIVDPLMEGGLPVSSSRIRAALEAGNLDEAELLLGRTPKSKYGFKE